MLHYLRPIFNYYVDDHWAETGSSGNPTSDTYHGTAPFSEPETKAVAAYVTANGPFVGAIDFHRYKIN